MTDYPTDWRAERLGNLFPKIVVGYVGNVNDHYCLPQDGIPFYRTLNIRDGEFRHIDLKHVTPEFHQRNKKSRIVNGDILIARVGANLGMVCNVTGIEGEANIANAIIIKTTDIEIAHSDFYTYFLLSPMGKAQIYSGAAGGAQGVFNTKLTQEIKAPIPPLPEQRKIADILSTWDAAIEKTESLLSNARTQKRALMQSLLTGKRRFPAYQGQPWKEVRLGDVATIIVSNVDKKSKDGEKPVRLCNYTDVYKRDTINPSQAFMKATATAQQIKKFGLKVGDVIVTKDSETADDIAMPTYVSETASDLVCGYHLAIIRAGADADGRFLKHYFELPHTRYYFGTRANGAIRFGLTIDGIEGAKVQLPPIEEQRCIASVIRQAEADVAAIAADITKLRTEKKALMQQLLTGKRRVVV